ncbi:TolC family protein [Komagataeibacter rhaeticus]|nr:TolC family protein [Komagataeibacter rhaeticus]
MGEPPRALSDELLTAAAIPPVPPRVPVGVPSELARRRPDIRRAEASLHAAIAQVGEAVAEFYPRVTINAGFGFESSPSATSGSGMPRHGMSARPSRCRCSRAGACVASLNCARPHRRKRPSITRRPCWVRGMTWITP